MSPPGVFLVRRLPYYGGGGGRACLFQNGGCLLLKGPPPPTLCQPQAKSGLVALRGRVEFLAPVPEIYFHYFFLCVGQLVSGWVPLELTPPLPWG